MIEQDQSQLKAFEQLEKEGEAFIDRLFTFFQQRKYLRSSIKDLEALREVRSSVKDLELAKEVNMAAGRELSDAVQIVSLYLPSAEKDLGKAKGIIDKGFRRNYSHNLGILRKGGLETVGDIRNASAFKLVRLGGISMDGVDFIKTIFARPQSSESKQQ